MLTTEQQTELARRVAVTMKALAGLVGVTVTDAKVASLAVADTAKALVELEQFVEGCKTEEPKRIEKFACNCRNCRGKP